MNQVWLSFLTGLTTGGISCAAVQGGLLATSTVSEVDESLTRNQKLLGILVFLISKLVAYSLLGFLLGSIGATFIVSPVLQGWMQILIGIFMIATAARLLNVHPIFRYFVIEPPRFIYRFMKKEVSGKSFLSPALLGAMTVLIPCGVTQAMMVLSLGSGSGLMGALILFAFVLGTSPIFFMIGLATSELMKKKSFLYLASAVILILGLSSINTGQILRGSPHIIQNYLLAAKSIFNSKSGTSTSSIASLDSNGKQEVIVKVNTRGYKPLVKKVKAGVPVKMKLVSNNAQGCVRSFVIPSLGISKILPENGTIEIEFTPTKVGTLPFSCGMGMYTGSLEVI